MSCKLDVRQACVRTGGSVHVQFAASVAAQAVLHSEDARLYKTRQAPGPDNVNWPALWPTRNSRIWRRIIAYCFYAVVMCIPIGIFGGILSQVRPPPSSAHLSVQYCSGRLCSIMSGRLKRGYKDSCHQRTSPRRGPRFTALDDTAHGVCARVRFVLVAVIPDLAPSVRACVVWSPSAQRIIRLASVS